MVVFYFEDSKGTFNSGFSVFWEHITLSEAFPASLDTGLKNLKFKLGE
jgi:hypothetical protein